MKPMLFAGDFNADPVSLRVFMLRFVDLALAYSLGAGKEPDATYKFKLDERAGSRRDFVVTCPDPLAAFTLSGHRQVVLSSILHCC